MSKQRPKSLGIKIAGWLILLALAAGGAGYYLLQESAFDVTALALERGPVEQTIAAVVSGTVTPMQKSMVAAGMLGTIKKVHVTQGDKVQQGDLLVELDHDELDAQLALAEANLKVGESRLEQARIGANISKDITSTQLSQANAQREQAEAEFARIKTLADRKAVSQSDLDKVTLALKVARETQAAAVAGQRENLVREEEIRSAESMIEQLRQAVQVAKAIREKAFIRAPFSGVVARTILDAGEAVAMGLPLLHLVRNDDMYIEAPFDEANAGQIHLGQICRIELDAYSDRQFRGEVSHIAPVVSINPDLSRTLNIRVKILEAMDLFIPGMSADVTIIAEQKPEVLKAPSESLVRDEFAYRIENGRAVACPVELGIGNWEFREILSGLNEGDLIVTSVAVKGLRDGSKVNVVDELPGY